MARSPADLAIPHSLRVIESRPGESLTVALPLPSDASALQKISQSSTPEIVTSLPEPNRDWWTRLSYSPGLLQIGTVLRHLGLRQVPNAKRIVFQYNNVIQLADAVAEVLKKLPTDQKGLIDIAADFTTGVLDEDIALLLHRFGNDIWGSGKERPWLLQASEGIAEYPRDLHFGNAADRNIMVYYLRLWILAKAFNTMRKHFQPRAKNTAFANLDDASRRTSSRRSGGPALLGQDNQVYTPGGSFAATTDRVATSNDLEAESTDSATHMRRTGRVRKPRKDLVDIDDVTEESADESSELEEEPDEDTPRHYKGPGRAWRKAEVDEDPAFLARKNDFSGKRRASDFKSLETPKRRGRPPKHSGKEARPVSARYSMPTQGLSAQQGNRRPRRMHRSESRVGDSSDESEDDNLVSTPAVTTQSRGGKSARQPPGACESCRRRRQKCDRARPECTRCIGLGFVCTYVIASASTIPSRTPSKKPAKRQSKSTLKVKAEKIEAETDVDSEEATSDQSVPNGILKLKKVDLPLDKDWDEDRWQHFYLQGNEDSLMLAMMLSLGLKATPRDRISSSFVVADYASLCKDVCKIAAKLCNKFSAADLIRFAADSSYLDEEIDIVFDNWSHVWSVDADRAKLLIPGTEPLYPKDLVFEEDDDRKLIWTYLHGWVFMVALMNCKQMHGAGVRNMRKVMGAKVPKYILDQWQSGGIYTFDSPEDLSRSESESKAAESIFADSKLQESESQLLEAIGDVFADAKTEQQSTATSNVAEPDSNTRGLPRRQQKRKDSSITTSEQSEAARPHKQRRIADRTISKPDDFTALFMSYLENFAEPQFNELAGLEAIEKELTNVRNYANGLDAKLRARLSPTVFNLTLPAWLTYRREIVEAKRKVASMAPVAQAPSRQVAIMERNRLATQLRMAHETFVDAGYDDLRPEQIIYRAMVTLMMEHGNSQTAEGIRRGLKDMEDEIAGLGDQLMSGGMKYVLGEAASVATLKDLQLHAKVGK